MRTKFVLALVVLAVFAIGGTLLALRRDSGAGGGDSPAPTGPRLDCPEMVELAEVDVGDPVTGRFVIRNAGSEPLEIRNVRTACACIGLQRVTADGTELITATTIAPGESGEFVLRFSANGLAGEPFGVGLSFLTNDPTHPEHRVLLRVSRLRGGLATYPAQVVLHVTRTGPAITRRLDLYDSGDGVRRVTGVRVVGLGEATCVFCPPNSPATTDARHLGRLIGHLDLVVTPKGVGSVSGQIEVTTGGSSSQPFVIPVQGEILGLFKVAPAAVVLPLRRSGEWSYTTRCTCRPTSGDALELEVTEVPAALTVKLLPATGDDPAYLEISVKPEFRSPPVPDSHVVKVRGQVGGQSVVMEIPVSVSRE